jgi:hypothetical protein
MALSFLASDCSFDHRCQKSVVIFSNSFCYPVVCMPEWFEQALQLSLACSVASDSVGFPGSRILVRVQLVLGMNLLTL